MGRSTTAPTYASTSIGYFNVGAAGAALNEVATDALFEIGNGTCATSSNALTVSKNGNTTIAGTLTESSDKRLKKDISPITFGLETILKLNPVEYNWIKDKGNAYKSLGLIAQEADLVVPNIVHTDASERKLMSVSYTELIPVLIKGMQEQQEVIKKQEATNTKQQETIEMLVKRLEALENKE